MAVEYDLFPTVEWALEFENAGAADTPILEAINALDVAVARGAGTLGALQSSQQCALLGTPAWVGCCQ